MAASDKLVLKKDNLPAPPALRKLVGPSFIILGLGLGSGEVILWPYLSSHYGLGIIWGALIGITIQFFINMEVERYALIYGESIFVGFVRLFKFLPLWFILSTFLGFGWPGIGLAGATLISTILHIESARYVGVVIFVVIGLILTLGKVLYKTVESLQKFLISIGVPFIFLLTLYLSSKTDFVELAKGLVGQGDGFTFLPEGIVLMTFLGALAYAGAGGNLNLAQSFYVRDKGYGMGKFADKIRGLFSGDADHQEVSLSGTTFEPTEENVSNFKKWWKVVNVEHAMIFWFLGLFTMLMLSLLAYTTVFGSGESAEGIGFVIKEASYIASRTLPFFGTLFLLVTGVMLSATQLTVLDSTSRIMTENALLLKPDKKFNVSKIYYLILWAQIMFGIVVFMLGFDQPLILITLGAVFNAFAMFVYIGLILFMNNKVIAKEMRPSIWRNLAMLFAFVFFGFFSALTIWQFLS
ncbi:Nramp family divalent metal transporter [candidate division WWE3 bacterium]|uniref:Nramp family divalent metal transporter n=1 Tax=candidate division WWE3 bacterium TaxID=2053526 RepID=A0A955LKI3_UNCKA|nr:Nramp family divalent metal transporter [candidate division WWE3 bacterium]